MRFAQRIRIPALAVCLGALALAPVVSAGAGVAQGRAALVNGVVISSEDFQDELQRVERLRAREEKKGGQAERAMAKKQVLENLIVRELLYQEAKKQGIEVPEAAVAAQLAELKKQVARDSDLADTLEQMGLSEGNVRAKVARGMAVQQLIATKFAKKGAVSEAEIAAYYERHAEEFREPLRLRLSHILIKSEPWEGEQRAESRARIEALRQRLLAGEDFAALAEESSECNSRKKGGDLGYFLPGQLAMNMEDEARALKPGEVSGIVADRYGFHLLKLTELRPASVPPLDQVRSQIRAKLKEEKELKALAPFVKKLRAAAKVEILLNEDEF